MHICVYTYKHTYIAWHKGSDGLRVEMSQSHSGFLDWTTAKSLKFNRSCRSHRMCRNPTEYLGIPKNISESHRMCRNPTECVGIPQNISESQRISRNPTEYLGIPQTMSESHRMSQNPTECLEIPQNMSQSHRISRNPTECLRIPQTMSHRISRNPTEYLGIPQTMSESHRICRDPTECVRIPQIVSGSRRICWNIKVYGYLVIFAKQIRLNTFWTELLWNVFWRSKKHLHFNYIYTYVYLHVYKYMHILYFHNNLGIWGGNLWYASATNCNTLRHTATHCTTLQ